MKKHISTLIIICTIALTAFFGACSSDDNDSSDASTALTLQASTLKTVVGETVTFNVIADKKAIEGVTITEQTLGIIKDLTWVPTQAGTFNFTATKEGYTKSKTITIVVEDAIGKLVLTTPQKIGKPNDVFEFTITANGQPVKDVEIEIIGKEKFKGTTWTAKEYGIFEFKAHKNGFASSDILTIEIKNYSYFTYQDQIYFLDKSYFNFYKTVTDDEGIFDVWGLVLMSDDFQNKIVFLAGFEREDMNEVAFPKVGEVIFGGFTATQFYINGAQIREISTMDTTMFLTEVEPFKAIREDFYLSEKVTIEFNFPLESNKTIKGMISSESELDFETIQTSQNTLQNLVKESDAEIIKLLKSKK